MHYTQHRLLAIILLGIFVVQREVATAQIENDRFAITGELMLPSGTLSKPFRAYLNGLVNVHPKLQYKPIKNMYLAIGPKYMYYTVSEFKVPEKTNGGMHAIGGGLEAGYTNWFTPRFGLELGVKVGAMHHIFNTGLLESPETLDAVFVEPALSLILASDEAVAYRWIIGYNWMGFDLLPEHLGLNTMGGYSAEDYDVGAQSILFGFGMTYYFGNQRTDEFIDDDSEK